MNPRNSSGASLTGAAAPPVTPKGMGDLLPPQAQARRDLAQKILHTCAAWGYQLATPPMFEHADVVARGSDVDGRDLLRFVEPESGEVAVLRPDITPQIARIVATRLGDRPGPWRLSYQGRIIRRRRGRARQHRQISQVGVECVGLKGIEGDHEVLTLMCTALDEAGLSDYRLELSEASLLEAVVKGLPDSARGAILEVILRKDLDALPEVCGRLAIPARTEKQLAALISAHGNLDALADASKRFRWEQARVALKNLRQLTDRLVADGLSQRIGIDLGEARGLGYYTGINFHVLASGPGEAVGWGGRYDALLARFGKAAPSTGFGIDLDNLQWALRHAGVGGPSTPEVRFLVAGGDEPARDALARAVRASGRIAATLPDSKPQAWMAFAGAWDYHVILVPSARATRALRVSDGAKRSQSGTDETAMTALEDWAREGKG